MSHLEAEGKERGRGKARASVEHEPESVEQARESAEQLRVEQGSVEQESAETESVKQDSAGRESAGQESAEPTLSASTVRRSDRTRTIKASIRRAIQEKAAQLWPGEAVTFSTYFCDFGWAVGYQKGDEARICHVRGGRTPDEAGCVMLEWMGRLGGEGEGEGTKVVEFMRKFGVSEWKGKGKERGREVVDGGLKVGDRVEWEE